MNPQIEKSKTNKIPMIELTGDQFIKAMSSGRAEDVYGNRLTFYLEGGYCLENVKVSNEILCIKQAFSTKIIIRNCEIGKFTIKGSSQFLYAFRIDNSQFTDDFTLEDTYFRENLEIVNTSFKGNLVLDDNSLTKSLVIEEVIVKKEFGSANRIQGSVTFRNSDFTTIGISDVIQGSLAFYYCRVEEELVLGEGAIKGNIEVLGLKAFSIGFIYGFEWKQIRISYCEFQEISLPCFIPDKAVFTLTSSRFKRIHVIDGFTNLGYMQWNHLLPFDSSEISLDGMMGKWDIINCNFEKTELTISSSKITDAFYTNSYFPKQLALPAFFTINDKQRAHGVLRDGYNQLKTLAQKQNDRKTFLHYQAEELRSFYNSLSLKNNTATKIQLFFMCISNDYGNNWVRGLCFTAVVNLLFLILTLSRSPIDLTQTVKFISHYFSFLFSLTTKPEFIRDDWEIIFFYFSRIFVAFGIYQTISGFRKFGKYDG